MSNLVKRIIFGALYGGIVVLATNTNKYIFCGVFFTFMLLCTYEFNKLLNHKSVYPYVINTVSFLFGVAVLFNLDLSNVYPYLPVLFLILLFSIFIYSLFSKQNISSNFIGQVLLNLIYLGLPFTFLNVIHESNPLIHGAQYKINLVLSMFILIWINDTFAYIIGSKFGKNKLFERISPKKTIEGFIGGFIFTIIGALVISYLNGLMMQNWEIIYNYPFWIGFALIVSIVGTIGDLVESMFKREAGVKDSSNLIPGHGGFLDRLDSVIFATPFIFIYLILTNHVS